MPTIDRLNRLEQVGWLPSAEEWTDLRRIRSEFLYATTWKRRRKGSNACNLRLPVPASCSLLDIHDIFSGQIQQRFPGLHPCRHLLFHQNSPGFFDNRRIGIRSLDCPIFYQT